MSDCSELMAKLSAIEAKLNAMDDKYIPKSQRSSIVDEGANKGSAIAKAAIIPIFGAYTLKTIHDSDFRAALNRAEKALGQATEAKGIANISRSEAQAAAAKAKRALVESAEAYFKSVDAKQLANRAYAVGKGAEFEAIKAKILSETATAKANQATKLAETAKTVANAAKGTAETAVSRANQAIAKIDDVARRLGKYIDDVAAKAGRALSTALDAIGFSKAAQATAGQAFKIAMQALGKIFLILDIISTIFSLLNAIDLRRRMNILEQKISIIEREISRILGLLFGIVSRLGRVEGIAALARSMASSAESIARQAQGTANQARNLANSAISQAAIAIAQVAIVGGVAATATGIARGAQSTATQALNRAKVPGPRGLPGARGLQGVAGVQGKQGLQGRVGLAGLHGRNGRNGINGINGKNGLPGKPITLVQRITTPGRVIVRNNNRTIVQNIMNPADTALLRQIHATTTATKAQQNIHTAISANTNIVVTESRTFLGSMQSFAAKAWETTRMSKAIELLTLATAIHNAAMLSRYTGQTVLDVIGNALSFIGIKDETGNALDLNQLLGNSVETMLKTLLGEQVYNDTSKAFQKANRILQIGTAIIWTVRSIQDTALDLAEWTANNTGKIGNALKRFGVVGENSYPWMSETLKAQNKWRNKMERYYNGLESVENVAESAEFVTGSFMEIGQEFGEIKEQRDQLRNTMTTGEPFNYPDNEPIAVTQNENKGNSVATLPTIDESLRSEN